MTHIDLTSIGYVHGDCRLLAELGEATAIELTQPGHGLAHYRVSALETWELAAAAGERSLASGGGEPDLLLYVTENDRQAVGALAALARRLGLARVRSLAISGHDCGNLGQALMVARDAVACGRHARVLLVTADRVPRGESRLMASGMSVFSDGSVACMVTAEAEGPRFRVHAVVSETDAGADAAESSSSMLATAGLAARAVAQLESATGRRPDAYRHAVFPNYRVPSQTFLASAVGVPEGRLLVGAIADLGHSFAADLLVTLHQARAAGTLVPGDRALLAATGPCSWSLIDVECL